MMNIYICNTYQYLYFCRKFTEMDKGKIKPKQHLEFASSADNKSYKKIFLNVKSWDIQQPIRHFKLFANWYITFHWQISRKKSTVFNHYKMNICDQLRLKSFDIRDAHGKFSKKFEFSLTSFEIYTAILQNVLWDQKFAKFLSFPWINIYKLPLRKNSARKTFVNTKILFASILPINCSFQQEYSM